MGEIFGPPKILHHARLLPYLKRRIPGIPITMEVDLTNICTHACPFCVGLRTPESNSMGETFTVAGDGESIPTERAADYIRQMGSAGVQGLIFTGGGEPTLHKDMEELTILARVCGMDVGLITHGGFLHKKNIEVLKHACSWIRVSVDAHDAASFKETHGKGVNEWNQAWDNIEALSAAPGDATIGVAYLATPENLADARDFVNLARNAKVDYAQIRPYHEHITLDISETLTGLKESYENDTFKVVSSSHKYSRVKDGKVTPRNYSYCHIGQFASVICANEKMYLCCHMRNQKQFEIGDLKESSFVEILMSAQRTRINKEVNVKDCLELCRGDHTNRIVQDLLDGKDVEKGDAPAHVSFL